MYRSFLKIVLFLSTFFCLPVFAAEPIFFNDIPVSYFPIESDTSDVAKKALTANQNVVYSYNNAKDDNSLLLGVYTRTCKLSTYNGDFHSWTTSCSSIEQHYFLYHIVSSNAVINERGVFFTKSNVPRVSNSTLVVSSITNSSTALNYPLPGRNEILSGESETLGVNSSLAWNNTYNLYYSVESSKNSLNYSSSVYVLYSFKNSDNVIQYNITAPGGSPYIDFYGSINTGDNVSFEKPFDYFPNNKCVVKTDMQPRVLDASDSAIFQSWKKSEEYNLVVHRSYVADDHVYYDYYYIPLTTNSDYTITETDEYFEISFNGPLNDVDIFRYITNSAVDRVFYSDAQSVYLSNVSPGTNIFRFDKKLAQSESIAGSSLYVLDAATCTDEGTGIYASLLSFYDGNTHSFNPSGDDSVDGRYEIITDTGLSGGSAVIPPGSVVEGGSVSSDTFSTYLDSLTTSLDNSIDKLNSYIDDYFAMVSNLPDFLMKSSELVSGATFIKRIVDRFFDTYPAVNFIITAALMFKILATVIHRGDN